MDENVLSALVEQAMAFYMLREILQNVSLQMLKLLASEQKSDRFTSTSLTHPSH